MLAPSSSAGKESACDVGDPVQFLGQEDPLKKGQAPTPVVLGFPGGSAGKESTHNVGDLGSIPGLGRSPGEENSYPFLYSGLENSMDCKEPYGKYGHLILGLQLQGTQTLVGKRYSI